MAVASARFLFVPLFPTSSSFPFKPSATAFPKLPPRPPKYHHSLLAAASSHRRPPRPFTSEQPLPEAVVDIDPTENSLPASRTYENDLVRLTLLGSVDFRQALTAAASDGGVVADEHLASGLTNMVVETLFPGHADDHSTIATKLCLPSIKVKEKAIKLKKKLLTKEILLGTPSTSILAMTFRQVVMQNIRHLKLAVLSPGTERSMDNLGNPREFSYSISYRQVPELLTLSSADQRIISAIAEVVCVAAFKDTERHFRRDSMSRASSRIFCWSNKHKQISSKDCSVVMYNILEHEILANAKILLETFNLGKHLLKGKKLKNGWWMSTAFSKLEKIGSPEFCAWISEFVPSYILTIDSNKFSVVEFEGWKKSNANRWEVLLTHSQMVGLADILDMFWEDNFTLPSKKLSCPAVEKPFSLDYNKGGSFLKMLSTVLVSGIFLVTISVMGKLCLSHLPMRKNFQDNPQASFSEINCVPYHSLDLSELVIWCVSIIKRFKDSFGWPGEIRTNSGGCAWIGELPKFLGEVDDNNSSILDASSISIPLAASEEEMKALEDIASYQVVVSSEGGIIGFQPTNRVAVNNWAANPLAKVLHGGKNLSPAYDRLRAGFLEPGLKISRPGDVVVLELLMSSSPKTYFAVVRAVDI
ncbi:hypothetical protein OROGR_003106 [Orobanche gracilis]